MKIESPSSLGTTRNKQENALKNSLAVRKYIVDGRDYVIRTIMVGTAGGRHCDMEKK